MACPWPGGGSVFTPGPADESQAAFYGQSLEIQQELRRRYVTCWTGWDDAWRKGAINRIFRLFSWETWDRCWRRWEREHHSLKVNLAKMCWTTGIRSVCGQSRREGQRNRIMSRFWTLFQVITSILTSEDPAQPRQHQKMILFSSTFPINWKCLFKVHFYIGPVRFGKQINSCHRKTKTTIL